MSRIGFLLSLLLLASCAGKPSLEQLDSEQWKSDPNGCKGVRLGMIETIRESRNLLIGWTSMEIDELLGNPDSRDLDKRHKLYYRYTISGSEHCTGTSAAKKYLQVRFNAINKADEAIVFESSQ